MKKCSWCGNEVSEYAVAELCRTCSEADLKPVGKCNHEDTIITLDCCGEKAGGHDIDYMYCPHCKDHATFHESCADCGEELKEYNP
jgi:hypothetical protein